MPFTAWGCGCVATSVLKGGKGAAGGGGGGGGGGGNVEIPVEKKKGQSASPPNPLHACYHSVLGGTDLSETKCFPSEGQDAQYCMIFKILNKKARSIKGEF